MKYLQCIYCQSTTIIENYDDDVSIPIVCDTCRIKIQKGETIDAKPTEDLPKRPNHWQR